MSECNAKLTTATVTDEVVATYDFNHATWETVLSDEIPDGVTVRRDGDRLLRVDLLPLLGSHEHAIGVGCDGCDDLWRAGQDTALAADEFASCQPCELGCTEACSTCRGMDVKPLTDEQRNDPLHFGYDPCPDCTDGTVPAVHTSVDECRPPLPEGWTVRKTKMAASDGRDYVWSVDCHSFGRGSSVRNGAEPSEAERDRALWSAVRDVVRQHIDTEEQP